MGLTGSGGVAGAFLMRGVPLRVAEALMEATLPSTTPLET